MLTKLAGSRAIAFCAVAAVALAVGAGGLAFAASRAGTVHACAAKRNGVLRLSARCRKDERAVSWSVRGPRGRRGRSGAQGGVGPQGPSGSAGGAGAPGSSAASIMTARTSATIGQEGFFAPSGSSTMSGTESAVTVLTPDATTVAQDLAVTDLTSTPGDNTRVYVLRVNGSDTSLTCSIVSGAHGCTDSVDTVSIPPASQVTIHRAVLMGTGGGADTTAVLAAWRATTP